MIKIFGYSLNRNYDLDGCCIRCPNCGSANFSEKVIDHVDGYLSAVCELSVNCDSCGGEVNYWAYGSFDPCFSFHDKSIPALKDRLVYKLKGWTTP